MVVNWIIFFILCLGTVCGAGVMGRDGKDSSIVDRIFSAMSTTCLLMSAIVFGCNLVAMGA